MRTFFGVVRLHHVASNQGHNLGVVAVAVAVAVVAAAAAVVVVDAIVALLEESFALTLMMVCDDDLDYQYH